MKKIFAFVIAIFFVPLPVFSQGNLASSFEYEKREPIVIPPDFPLVLIPMVHKGKDQFHVLEGELEHSVRDLKPDPKTGRLPAVLWLEGKGVALPEMVRAVEKLIENPEVGLNPKYQTLPLDEVLRQVSSNNDSALELYQSLDAYYEFWNESSLYRSPDRYTEKNKSLRLIHDGFFKSILSWGIEKGLRVEPEERSLKVWKRIYEMYRYRALADQMLMRGDFVEFERYLELSFRTAVDMIYLRDREIWQRLALIHSRNPEMRIIVPIGRAHVSDFRVSSSQSIQNEEGVARDPIGSEKTIEQEIRGTLSPKEREDFIWLDYLNSKLIAGARESSDISRLSHLVVQIYERINLHGMTPKEIIREVGTQFQVEDRDLNPRQIRQTLISILEEHRLIDAQEKAILLG